MQAGIQEKEDEFIEGLKLDLMKLQQPRRASRLSNWLLSLTVSLAYDLPLSIHKKETFLTACYCKYAPLVFNYNMRVLSNVYVVCMPVALTSYLFNCCSSLISSSQDLSYSQHFKSQAHKNAAAIQLSPIALLVCYSGNIQGWWKCITIKHLISW